MGITDCITCEESKVNAGNITCQQCNTTYVANTAGTSCGLCSSNITNCYDCDEVLTNGTVTGSVCTDCDSQYYVNSQGTCSSCTNTTYNCGACVEAGSYSFNCTSCAAGYWLN